MNIWFHALIISATLAALAPAEQALHFDKHKATVLVFLATDCPIANGMAPELARIHADYSPESVQFYRVYADDLLTEEDINRHGKDYNLPFPAVHDANLALVKRSGATISPEAAVYDKLGKRVYLGRINNRYEDLGKYRQAATVHDLRNALDAVLDGKAPEIAQTKAVGCYLPKPKISDTNEPKELKKND